MINEITRIFQTPSIRDLVRRELESSQRELLTMQSAAEYAMHMCDYHSGRITRLSSHLKNIDDITTQLE